MFQFNLSETGPSFWFRIILILAGSYILNYFLRKLFLKAFNKVNTPKTKTVLSVTQNGVSVFIAIVAGLMLLSAFNINILPLLASASILGFAVGFGSQALIKDLISGVFLLSGETFYEGDIIKVAGIEGKVEKVGIRAVTLRDIDGVVHTIPNGTITTVANLTREWSRANIDIGVSSDHPIDQIMDLFKQEIDNLKNDPVYGSWIIGNPKIDGISELAAGKVVIRTQLKTNQAKKWDMEREFKYRIKKRFEQDNLKFA